MTFDPNFGNICGIANTSFDSRDGNWHFYAAVYNGTNNHDLYIDGDLHATGSGCGTANSSGAQYNMLTKIQTAPWRAWQDEVDDFIMVDVAVGPDDIEEIFVERLTYVNYSVPLGPTSSLNITQPIPNNQQFNQFEVNITGNVNSSYQFNTTLWVNGVINQTLGNISFGVNKSVNYSLSFGPTTETQINYTINYNNGVDVKNSTPRTFYIDNVNPSIQISDLNSTLYFQGFLNQTINASDTFSLFSFNVSIDDTQVFYEDEIFNTTYQYNLSFNLSTLGVGRHVVNITVADGHTAKRIRDYDVRKSNLIEKSLEYRFSDRPGSIKVEAQNPRLLDRFDTQKKKDRYTFTYKTNNQRRANYGFVVESEHPISIVDVPGSEIGQWLISNGKWIDFYTPEDEEDSVRFIRNGPNRVVAVVENALPIDGEIQFNSIGDLNYQSQTYDVYYANLTSVYTGYIFSGFDASYNLLAQFGNLLFDPAIDLATATLEWNGTNYSSVEQYYNVSDGSWTKSFPALSVNENITHKWYLNISNLTNPILQTGEVEQIGLVVDVGECIAGRNFTIANLTYYDEFDDSIINLTNNFELVFYDGATQTNVSGSFIQENNSRFCTNVDPSISSFNWNVYGTWTLSKEDYVTRVVDVPSGDPYVWSNSPITELPLYLISTGNSSTITYTWYTTNFQLIDGTMRVYECKANNTLNLVESVPIIDGFATANLELLSQPYSYDVVIGSTVYNDPVGYSKCHIESTTERTFFVNTDEIDVGALIGLGSVQCNLVRHDNFTVNMTWEANPNGGGYVQGCLVGDRDLLSGNVRVYENCSSSADGYSRQVSIPNNGNKYTISAYLIQGNNSVWCPNQLTFDPNFQEGGPFGVNGALAAFLLILAIGLFFSTGTEAGDNTLKLTGAGIATVLAWYLGILAFEPYIVSAIVIFLVIIAMIGRYARSNK